MLEYEGARFPSLLEDRILILYFLSLNFSEDCNNPLFLENHFVCVGAEMGLFWFVLWCGLSTILDTPHSFRYYLVFN